MKFLLGLILGVVCTTLLFVGGGLVTATVQTLIMIPAIYAIVYRIQLRKHWTPQDDAGPAVEQAAGE